MGLLEQILARLDRLEKHNGVTGDSAATPAAPASPLPTAAEVTAAMMGTGTSPATSPVAPAAPATGGDAELINKHGVPWHPDHHAATKTQNNDGSWKGKKGGDKAAREAYEAQFTAAAATPAAPATPAVPATPGTPAAPAAPGVKVASQDQIEAVKYVKSLTDDYKVPYQSVVDALLVKHGVDTFTALDPKHDATVKADSRAWLEKLAEIDEAVETLDTINTETGGVHGLPGHVATVLTTHGGSAVIGQIAHSKLDAAHKAITDYLGQWKTWFEQTTGKTL